MEGIWRYSHQLVLPLLETLILSCPSSHYPHSTLFLHVCSNQLASLPQQLIQLHASLRTLLAGSNHISDLPEGFSKWVQNVDNISTTPLPPHACFACFQILDCIKAIQKGLYKAWLHGRAGFENIEKPIRAALCRTLVVGVQPVC